MIIVIPVVESNGKYYLSPHFGKAPKYAFIEVKGKEFNVVDVVNNPVPPSIEGGGRGRAIADLIISKGAEAVIALEVGPGAFRFLKEANIRIYYYPPRRGLIPIEDALDAFINGKLEEGLEPREID
ncbi:MAG: NifB/NifX family molybdenum-iron cluster-binding protein [Vulcanisaeta sp.]|jgi:predicted Fe-Mo cluster-binding NifX family protein|uniref:NifB/NifX family molybdenum-iron cluster-binding protein n=1 Tax=Vulcanisaeta sp. TaxID=2020871 RepID=UPI003D14E00D